MRVPAADRSGRRVERRNAPALLATDHGEGAGDVEHGSVPRDAANLTIGVRMPVQHRSVSPDVGDIHERTALNGAEGSPDEPTPGAVGCGRENASVRQPGR